MESTQVATDSIPWDREFRAQGTTALAAFLPPSDHHGHSQVHAVVSTAEPRWFYGVKSFSETTIGCVPGAILARYNASASDSSIPSRAKKACGKRALQKVWKPAYSRRHFVKAAGTGIALTALAGETAFAAVPSRGALPMTKEKATFIINGKPLVAEYEARTTLWEVVAVQLGLTGTTRSCNRASCGACSVLIDGTPFYSCHTLATEASGKKIFTIEGLGDENNLHLLQKIGYMHMAADWFLQRAGR